MVEYKFQETLTNHLKYVAARSTWQEQRFVSSVIVEVFASGLYCCDEGLCLQTKPEIRISETRAQI